MAVTHEEADDSAEHVGGMGMAVDVRVLVVMAVLVMILRSVGLPMIILHSAAAIVALIGCRGVCVRVDVVSCAAVTVVLVFGLHVRHCIR